MSAQHTPGLWPVRAGVVSPSAYRVACGLDHVAWFAARECFNEKRAVSWMPNSGFGRAAIAKTTGSAA